MYSVRTSYYWECGEIGRHDGLKIHCLVIGVRVQVPPFPNKVFFTKKKLESLRYDHVQFRQIKTRIYIGCIYLHKLLQY